jgi:hypothetical protein
MIELFFTARLVDKVLVTSLYEILFFQIQFLIYILYFIPSNLYLISHNCPSF